MHLTQKALSLFLHFKMISIKRWNALQFTETVLQKACPGLVPDLGALDFQQDTFPGVCLQLSLLGRCWHQSYATFQLHIQEAVTMCMVQTTREEVWGEYPRSFCQLSPGDQAQLLLTDCYPCTGY